MAFVALLTFGTLQSCKDDLSGLEHQTKFDVANLQYQIDRVKQVLEDSLAQHRKEIDQNRGDINQLLKTLNLYATIRYVDSCDNALKTALLKNDSIVADSLSKKINGAIERFNKFEEDTNLLLDSLIDSLNNRYVNVIGKLESQQKSIDEINNTLKQIKIRQDSDSVRIDRLAADFADLKIKTDSVFNEVFKEGGLKDQVALLNLKVDSIDAKLVNLFNRFDALITGILIQGVKSPVFGDFSLPIGVRSNILFNYYGEQTWMKDIKFPSNVESYSAGGDPSDINFTKLGIPAFATIKDGYYEDELSLGEVFVTLNPIGHVFNETPIKLQNSKGDTLSVTVKVTPSDELLTFGYHQGTRGTIESGLYSGEAILTVVDKEGKKSKDLEKVEFTLDKSFVRSIKDAVSNPSKATALDVIKAVYDQLGSKKLPAYALRYDWNVAKPVYNLEEAVKEPDYYSVLSQYDLAVVAAKPYGFNTFDCYLGSSKQLPIIGHIDNFISELIDRSLNNFNLEGENIKIDNKSIGFTKVSYYKDENTGKLMAKVVGLTVDDKPVNIADFECTPYNAVEKVTEKIVEALTVELKAQNNDELKAEINTKVDLVLLQMQKQINDVVNDITLQIKSTFTDMGKDTDKYFDKLNRAAKLYDRFASKINNFLKNPNAYLQACAFYDCNGSMGVVSGNLSDPTPLVVKSGDKLDLYLSTYTAELIAPAYKKYVAVCGVYDLKGNKVTKVLGNLNKGPKVNKVLSGSEIEVSFNIGGFEKGYIYEFVYQAIDYCGYTSTKKFYIQVK